MTDQLAGRNGFLLANKAQSFQGSLGAKGGLAGEQLVKDGTQAVNIGGGGELFGSTTCLFGCHVTGRPEDGEAMSQRRVILDQFGQAEIGHVGIALLIQENIGGLEISVENATLMGVVDRASHDSYQACYSELVMADFG